ncbi:MAG: S9 family peptidase, partial [Candidatus Aminicenantes bacterium]|nr:S9 family peptidase [Candidatus Aminicenantes bacterium]
MKKATVSIFLFCLILTAMGAAEKRPMTVDDALNMIGIGNVMISPDGQWVFYSQSELEWDKNKRKSTYFMIPAGGGESFRYLGEEGGSSFQFSPDGTYLALKRLVDKKSQIFLMRMAGGEAVQLTSHKESVGSFLWTPDSKNIIFTATKPRSKEEEKRIKDGEDVIFVDEAPNGQNSGQWEHLYSFDLASKSITPVLEEDLLIGRFDISPDGQAVLFTARTSNRRNDGNTSEIYKITLGEKEKVRLTTNNSPEGDLVWAPDGTCFAFTACDDKEWLNRNEKIWIMDSSTGNFRLLSGKYEGGIRGLTWTPDSRFLLFNGQQGTNTNLFKIDTKTGEVVQLTDITGSLRVAGFSRDRKTMVYSFSDFDTPTDVYASSVSDFSPIRLTDANPWVEKKLLLADMKVIQWKSTNDMTIEGLLHIPQNPGEKSPYPLILNIHGGPAGCFTNSFRAGYHIHAGLGYASLSPNVRGSSGYTDKLMEGNTTSAGDGIGKGDYWDLMNGVDTVIKQGLARPDQLGLRGWSYGGILGGWTISHTDRFKAASIGAGVYDWTSEYGPGFNFDVRLWHIGGTPWTNPEGYREQSTLTHVENITT